MDAATHVMDEPPPMSRTNRHLCHGRTATYVMLSLSKHGPATHGYLMPILRQAQDDTVAAHDDMVAAHDDMVAAEDDMVAAQDDMVAVQDDLVAAQDGTVAA